MFPQQHMLLMEKLQMQPSGSSIKSRVMGEDFCLMLSPNMDLPGAKPTVGLVADKGLCIWLELLWMHHESDVASVEP